MLLQIHEPGQTPGNEKEGVIIGIDFGTTNSVVSMVREGVPEIVPLEGKRLVPSIISYKEGKVLVGWHASQEAETTIVRSIKRSIEPGSLNQSSYSKKPLEIAGDILRYLKTEAERSLKDVIIGAVITVPAYYGESAREITRAAASLAGIPVLRLLSEPTAAALAYHLDEHEEGVSLVYDLGGGTFDVSVLRLEKGVFQVLAVRGDMELGGDDIDRALFDFIHSKVPSLMDPEGRVLARQIKEHLSLKVSWEGMVQGTPIQVTRDVLNQLVDPLLKRTMRLCDKALQDAGVLKKDLRNIVLVGGATRMPYVQNSIENFFGQVPLCNQNPDEIVALGAAMHAESLMTGKGKLLLDVTPFSLGIETLGGAVENIILRNAPLPCSVSQKFTTSQDGQTKIKIHVVQGDSHTLSGCQSLATFVLADILPLPAGKPQLMVTFTLDADGILSVSAEELLSQKRHIIQIAPSFPV